MIALEPVRGKAVLPSPPCSRCGRRRGTFALVGSLPRRRGVSERPRRRKPLCAWPISLLSQHPASSPEPAAPSLLLLSRTASGGAHSRKALAERAFCRSARVYHGPPLDFRASYLARQRGDQGEQPAAIFLWYIRGAIRARITTRVRGGAICPWPANHPLNSCSARRKPGTVSPWAASWRGSAATLLFWQGSSSRDASRARSMPPTSSRKPTS